MKIFNLLPIPRGLLRGNLIRTVMYYSELNTLLLAVESFIFDKMAPLASCILFH